MARLVLQTDLSPEECFSRITKHSYPWPLIGWLEPLRADDNNYLDPLLSGGTPPRVKLLLRSHARRFWRGGAFYGRIVEEAGRTSVYGRMGASIPQLCFGSLFTLPLVFLALVTMGPALNRPLVQVAVLVALLLVLPRVFRAVWDHGSSEDPYSVRLHDILTTHER